jgi:hypothetical protein
MKKRNISITGACLLSVGCFLPAMHVPLIGSVSYVLNGSGDGIIVVTLAMIGGVCALGDRIKAASVTAWLNLLIISVALAGFADKPVDNPFAKLVTLGEAWPVMIVGALAMIVASFMSDNQTVKPPEAIAATNTGWKH